MNESLPPQEFFTLQGSRVTISLQVALTQWTVKNVEFTHIYNVITNWLSLSQMDMLIVNRSSSYVATPLHLANAPASNGVIHVVDSATLSRLPDDGSFELGNPAVKHLYTYKSDCGQSRQHHSSFFTDDSTSVLKYQRGIFNFHRVIAGTCTSYTVSGTCYLL